MAARPQYCLITIGRWIREFESHSWHGFLLALPVSVLPSVGFGTGLIPPAPSEKLYELYAGSIDSNYFGMGVLHCACLIRGRKKKGLPLWFSVNVLPDPWFYRPGKAD